MSYVGYSSNLAPTHCRFGILFWILIKSGTHTLQFWCLILEPLQIWHLRIEELVSYLRYLSNLAPTHCKFGVLFFILIKSGTNALHIWCLIFHAHQIWHPRITGLVSCSGFSLNMALAHCGFCLNL